MTSTTAAAAAAAPVGARATHARRIRPRRRGLPILVETIQDHRIGLAVVIGFILLIAMFVAGVPDMYSAMDLEQMLSNPAMVAMLGGQIPELLSGFTTNLAFELYSMWLPLLIGGYVAFMAGGLLAGPVESGVLDLDLARPISRGRYYVERWLGLVTISVLISGGTLLSVWLGVRLFSADLTSWAWLLITQGMATLFLIMAGGVGLLISSFSSAGRRAGSAAMGLLVLSYIFSALGSLSEGTSWLAKLSVFHYAPLATILVNQQLTWWHPIILVAVGLVTGLCGLVIFNRRDLPAL